MLTCKFCGSHNIKKVGGDNGNPFDRRGERLFCADCGRTLANAETNFKPSISTLAALAEEIENQAQNQTPWRARAEAELLQAGLEAFSATQENYGVVAALYEALSHFYRNVCDRKRAYEYGIKGSEVALAFGDKELAADMAYSAYRYLLYLPTEIRPIIDEQKIQNEYTRYAMKVLSYQKMPVMKVDPIEHTEAFLSVYDKVMERVWIRLEKEGNLHIPQQIWSMMAEEFEKEGIFWKNPGLMNPKWRFD